MTGRFGKGGLNGCLGCNVIKVKMKVVIMEINIDTVIDDIYSRFDRYGIKVGLLI